MPELNQSQSSPQGDIVCQEIRNSALRDINQNNSIYEYEIVYNDGASPTTSCIGLCSYDEWCLQNKDLILTTDTEIYVAFSYPFKREFIWKLKSRQGFTLGIFIKKVIGIYERMYEEEDRDVGHPTLSYSEAGMGAMCNRMTSNGRYGIWGHGIGDLVIEGISRRRNGVFDICMGS